MAINKTLWTTFRAKDFVSSEIKMMQKSMNSFTNSAVKNFKKMERHATILNNSMKKMSSGFGKYLPFAGGLGAVGLFAGGRSAVESAAQLESLATVIKSSSATTEEGAESMAFLSKLSKDLKIDFIAASEGFSLLAANAKASKVPMEQMRQVFEGVSKLVRVQALDAEKSMSVYRAIGQMYSKQTIQAQEATIQLAEAMPAAKALLAEAFRPGISMKQFMKAMEQGDLKAKKILPTFAKLAAELAEGGLDASLETATAKLTDLSNQWLMTKATIGTALIDAGVIDALQKGAKVLSEWVDSNKELIKLKTEQALDGIYGFFEYIKNNGDEIKRVSGALIGVWGSVKAMAAMKTLIELIQLLGTAAATTVGVVLFLAAAIGWSAVETHQFRKKLGALDKVMNPAQGFGAGFLNFFKSITTGNWRNLIVAPLQIILSVLQSLYELLALMPGAAGRFFKSGANDFGKWSKDLDVWANRKEYGLPSRQRVEQMNNMTNYTRSGAFSDKFLSPILTGGYSPMNRIPIPSFDSVSPEIYGNQQDALSSNGLTNEKVELIIKILSENIIEADISGAPSYNLRFSD